MTEYFDRTVNVASLMGAAQDNGSVPALTATNLLELFNTDTEAAAVTRANGESLDVIYDTEKIIRVDGQSIEITTDDTEPSHWTIAISENSLDWTALVVSSGSGKVTAPCTLEYLRFLRVQFSPLATKKIYDIKIKADANDPLYAEPALAAVGTVATGASAVNLGGRVINTGMVVPSDGNVDRVYCRFQATQDGPYQTRITVYFLRDNGTDGYELVGTAKSPLAVLSTGTYIADTEAGADELFTLSASPLSLRAGDIIAIGSESVGNTRRDPTASAGTSYTHALKYKSADGAIAGKTLYTDWSNGTNTIANLDLSVKIEPAFTLLDQATEGGGFTDWESIGLVQNKHATKDAYQNKAYIDGSIGALLSFAEAERNARWLAPFVEINVTAASLGAVTHCSHNKDCQLCLLGHDWFGLWKCSDKCPDFEPQGLSLAEPIAANGGTDEIFARQIVLPGSVQSARECRLVIVLGHEY